MKLSSDAVIDAAKLSRYLLVPQKRNDKAAWLAGAGYSLANWQLLQVDLREQLLPLEATLVEETAYGRLYEIAGRLKGPNGRVLRVRSIWIVEVSTGQTKFVTLFPDKR